MKPDNLYFKMLRESLGLSQHEYADWIGVGVKTLNRWETGEKDPQEDREDQLTNLYAEYRDHTRKMADRAVAFAHEHKPDVMPLPVYTNDADYKAVSWPGGETWPTSKMHRRQILEIYVALMERTDTTPILIPFDRRAYLSWLNGREESTAHRSQWAAERAQDFI